MKKLYLPLLCATLLFLSWHLRESPSPFLIPYYDEEMKLYGYCTMDGKEVISPHFAYAELFSDNGLAIVVDKDETGTGAIDKTGKYILPPKFSFYGRTWSCGLMPLCDPDIKRFNYYTQSGYYNERGRCVIKPQYDFVSTFSDNGLARVRVGDFESGKWGYIDKSGVFVISPAFDEAEDFAANSLARVRIGNARDGRWGYIDKLGSIVIEPQFRHANDFSVCGLARVWTENNEAVYINEAGEFVTDPAQLYPQLYAEKGPIRVALDKGYKYLDEKGETIFELDMPYAEDFTKDGIAKAGYYWYNDYYSSERHNPIYHYINTRGEIIRPQNKEQ